MANSKTLMCDTCLRTLDIRFTEDGAEYIHTPQDPDDHPPVPVEPDGRLLGRCDFCNVSPPTHEVHARSFTAPDGTNMSGGNWAACAACAALIAGNHWTQVLNRAVNTHAHRHGRVDEETIALISALFARLRGAMLGPITELPRKGTTPQKEN